MEERKANRKEGKHEREHERENFVSIRFEEHASEQGNRNKKHRKKNHFKT